MRKNNNASGVYPVAGELYVRANVVEIFLKKIYPWRKVSVIREIQERRSGWIGRLLKRRIHQ